LQCPFAVLPSDDASAATFSLKDISFSMLSLSSKTRAEAAANRSVAPNAEMMIFFILLFFQNTS